MVSLEKWMILTPLLKLPKNGEDWGKLIVAKGFKKFPKIQNIAQYGHTGRGQFLRKMTWANAGNLLTILFHLMAVEQSGRRGHF